MSAFLEFPAAASTIVFKTQFRKSSNNSARICNLAIFRRHSRTLQPYKVLGRKAIPRHRRRAAIPLPRPSTNSEKDLQSGNLSAAQNDFKTIQQDFKNHAAQQQNDQASGTGSNAVSQLFEQLGQELQSGKPVFRATDFQLPAAGVFAIDDIGVIVE